MLHYKILELLLDYSTCGFSPSILHSAVDFSIMMFIICNLKTMGF